MIDTFQLTRDCIRLEQEGVADEEMVKYLTDKGLAEPMALMMVEQAQYLLAKMVRGRNYIIAGVAAAVMCSLMAVLAFMSSFIIYIIYLGIAVGIGLTIHGVADVWATRQYR